MSNYTINRNRSCRAGSCPHCQSAVISLGGPRVACTTCAAQGHFDQDRNRVYAIERCASCGAHAEGLERMDGGLRCPACREKRERSNAIQQERQDVEARNRALEDEARREAAMRRLIDQEAGIVPRTTPGWR